MGRALRLAYAAIYLVLLYGPILLLVIFSFNSSVYVAFPLKTFTLQWYQQMTTSAGLLDALANSLKVAVFVSFAATATGTMAALAVDRYRFRGRSAFGLMLFVPLSLPTVVVGVAMLSLFMLGGMGLSLATVGLGHLVVCTPFAFAVVRSRLAGLNPDFERASADLGERPLATFVRVTLPLILPGVVSSLLLTFTISFDEFILSFFLSSNSPTLPVYMWSQMRFPDRLPMVLALASVIVITSAVLIAAALALRGPDTLKERFA